MQHNEIVGLIYQYLNENGLEEVGKKLSKESKLLTEPEAIKELKESIIANKFDDAVDTLENEDFRFSRNEKNLIVPQIRLFQIHQELTDLDKPSKVNKVIKLIRKLSDCPYDKKKFIPKCLQLLLGKSNEVKDLKSELFTYSSNISSLFAYIDTIMATSKNPNLRTILPHQLTNIIETIKQQKIKECKCHNTEKENISIFGYHSCKDDILPHKLLFEITEPNGEEVVAFSIDPNLKKMIVLLDNNDIVLYNISLIDSNGKKFFEAQPLNTISHYRGYEISKARLLDEDRLLVSCNLYKSMSLSSISTGEVKRIDFKHKIIESLYFIDNEGTEKIVASINRGFVIVYNLKTETFELEKNIGKIDLIQYSPITSSFIFVNILSRTISVHDALSLKKTDSTEWNDVIVSIELSKDGRYLLVNTSVVSPRITLYDLITKKYVREFYGLRQEGSTIYNQYHSVPVYNQCRFGGVNENFIIAGGTGKTMIWNINDSNPVSEIKCSSTEVFDLFWGQGMKEILITCGIHGLCIFGNKDVIGGALRTEIIKDNYGKKILEEGNFVYDVIVINDMSDASFHESEQEEFVFEEHTEHILEVLKPDSEEGMTINDWY